VSADGLQARSSDALFSSTEQITVVQAIAIHAGEPPNENQRKNAALEGLSPVPVNIEAAAERASAQG
jgi:hypothetical protein